MLKEKKIIEYSIENIKAREMKGKDFDFFPFEYFATDIEHLKNSHRHDFHAFIFVLSGSGSHIIDFIEYPLKANRCFYISYGQIHAWKSLKSVTGYVLLFTDDFYNAIYTGNELIKSDKLLSCLSIFTDIPKSNVNEWTLLFEQIQNEFNTKTAEWKLVICLLLKVLVLKIRRLGDDELFTNEILKSSYHIIVQYKEMINEYFVSYKTPKEYAALLNITPNYLSNVCKRITGQPAGELIKDRIVLEAKRLIIHTQLTISEITYQLGFKNKSHFGKYFKKYTSLSPDQFRKEYSK
ncbi:MAG: helix-turn-helix domain-containing protein [Cytophagales bacterium]|nr:helix-turn-helix domain-containing protein [Cytophaga sp.]